MAAMDFPANPTNGQVYLNYIYNTAKGAWLAKPLTPGQAQPSATAPTSPSNGDQWYNTNDGNLYVYYNDGDTSQWVQVKSDATLSSTLGNRVTALEALPTGLVRVSPTSVTVGSGSASVNANGLVTFTGASSISLNGVFTSAYTDYRIMFDQTAASAYADGNLRMRVGGVDAITNYYRNGIVIDGATITGFQSANDTNYGNALTTHPTSSNSHAQSAIEIRDPFVVKPTPMQVINGAWSGSLNRHISTTGFHATPVSYDGFTIYLSSGNFAGTFQVYGYR